MRRFIDGGVDTETIDALLKALLSSKSDDVIAENLVDNAKKIPQLLLTLKLLKMLMVLLNFNLKM